MNSLNNRKWLFWIFLLTLVSWIIWQSDKKGNYQYSQITFSVYVGPGRYPKLMLYSSALDWQNRNLLSYQLQNCNFHSKTERPTECSCIFYHLIFWPFYTLVQIHIQLWYTVMYIVLFSNQKWHELKNSRSNPRCAIFHCELINCPHYCLVKLLTTEQMLWPCMTIHKIAIKIFVKISNLLSSFVWFCSDYLFTYQHFPCRNTSSMFWKKTNKRKRYKNWIGCVLFIIILLTTKDRNFGCLL